MSRARIYARNLAANWIGYGANLVVMFFLSPFVVHSLGTTTYGVWSLIVSLTGYLGLAELGTRAGLGRFINFYLGRKEIDKVNGVISTAMAFFLACGLILLAAAGTLGAFFGSLFTKVPPELVGGARLAILLIALNLWLSFLGAAFNQVLTAFERFDISNAINMAVLAVRTAGTVIALKRGGGIVELAFVQVASSVVGVLAAYVVAHRIFPELRARPRLVSRAHFRELFGFGIWAFIGSIATQLVYWTDLIVITVLLGPAMVTFYTIAGMLVIYGRGLIGQSSSILYPQIVKDCARRDWFSLRNVFKRGSTLVMAVATPLLVGLIVFGREFITLWMGPSYSLSYPVLLILAFSQFPVVANFVASPIYSGLHKVKLGAALTLSQGLSNLGLTLCFVMVFRMGIEGVAWGTFYPRVVCAALGTLIAMRWIHLSVKEFLTTTVLRWAVLIAAFSAVCASIAALPLCGRWDYFFLKCLIAMLLYCPLAWVFLPSKEDRERIGRFISTRMVRKSRSAETNPVCGSVEDR